MSGKAVSTKPRAQAKRTARKEVPGKSAKRASQAATPRGRKSSSASPRRAAVENKGTASTSRNPDPAELSHRLHLLLHSIHQIERYEERLCSIADAIKRTGKLNTSLRHDLQTLIEELPSDEFLHDLDAVRNAVLA